MLKSLKLKNVALIEIIEINFEKGLNVFTGESGSGKSLILDSLNSLFGGTNIPINHLIRPGQRECFIQGKFEISPRTKICLANNGFNFQDQVKVERVTSKIDNKVKTRYFVNNASITKKKLESLGVLLLDFAGQKDTFLFKSQEYLKSIIDELGAIKLVSLSIDIQNKWKSLNILKREIDSHLQKKQYEQENYFASAKILQILEDANLNDHDEIDELKSKQLILANNFELNRAIKSVLRILSNSDDDVSSVSALLSDALKQLNKVSQFDNNLDKYADELLSAQSQVENVIYSLIKYLQFYESTNDENDLNALQKRLYDLQNLEKTFSLELPELINKRNELRQLSIGLSKEDLINKLKLEFTDKSDLLNKLFKDQSAFRKKIAKQLEGCVLKSLNDLGLNNAIFKIDFEETTPNAGGQDKITFLFSANPDQALAPISKIISGGEMSRFLLALKSSMANTPNTLFCDEIDNGLSGRSLISLLNLVKKLSTSKQILCITHHPLLAASASVHFKVEKKLINGLTYTSLKKLTTKKQKQNELVELIGGGFDEANDYASILINKSAA